MTEEIKNDIDKLDGMIKIKGKCGYEIIGGCSDLRRLEQENKELKEKLEKYSSINEQDTKDYAILRNALEEIREILNNECGVISNAKVVGLINEVLDK